MLILALESSSKPASAAVYEHEQAGCGKLLGQYYQNNGFSHSRTLLVMAESLLRNLDLKPSDIELVAVANGPGSFTGIRIGVSAAKGLALGLDVPVYGASTLEAMAYQVGQADVVLPEITAGKSSKLWYAKGCKDFLICPVMDARRGQVYNALFRRENGSLNRLRDDRAISLDELIDDLKSFDLLFMPVGDGADLLLLEVGGSGNDLTALPPCPLSKYQTAYGVALAASAMLSPGISNPISASQLEPIYLRPSQAEREFGAVLK